MVGYSTNKYIHNDSKGYSSVEKEWKTPPTSYQPSCAGLAKIQS
jgi:hypothetical protein